VFRALLEALGCARATAPFQGAEGVELAAMHCDNIVGGIMRERARSQEPAGGGGGGTKSIAAQQTRIWCVPQPRRVRDE